MSTSTADLFREHTALDAEAFSNIKEALMRIETNQNNHLAHHEELESTFKWKIGLIAGLVSTLSAIFAPLVIKAVFGG